MKRAQFDFTYSPQSQNPAAPQNPNAAPGKAPASPNGVTLAPGVTRPDLMPQTPVEENFFETGLLPKQGPEPSNEFSPLLPGQSPLPNPVPNQANRFFPQAPPSTNTSTFPGGPFPAGDNAWMDEWWKDAAAKWRPGMTWDGPPEMLPSSMSQAPNAVSNVVPLPQAPLSGRQQRQQIREEGRNTRKSMKQEAAEKAYQDMQNAINQQNARVPQQAYGGGLRRFVSGGVDPKVGMDKPWVPETITKHMDYRFGKDNEFLAPGIMAGLDALGDVAASGEANAMTRKAMGKFGADQVMTAMPETSGSRGRHTFNEGYQNPNENVPTQFQGYNFKSNYAADGGEMSEGDEMYLDEDTINAILAAGGQVEYLD
jgi:hypothetical protein